MRFFLENINYYYDTIRIARKTKKKTSNKMKYQRRSKKLYNVFHKAAANRAAAKKAAATKAAIDELNSIVEMASDEARSDIGSFHTSSTSPRVAVYVERNTESSVISARQSVSSSHSPLSEFERELEDSHNNRAALEYSIDVDASYDEKDSAEALQRQSQNENDQDSEDVKYESLHAFNRENTNMFSISDDEDLQPPPLMDRISNCLARDMVKHGKFCVKVFESIVDGTMWFFDGKEKTKQLERKVSDTVDELNRQFDSDIETLVKQVEVDPSVVSSVWKSNIDESVDDINSQLGSLYCECQQSV